MTLRSLLSMWRIGLMGLALISHHEADAGTVKSIDPASNLIILTKSSEEQKCCKSGRKIRLLKDEAEVIAKVKKNSKSKLTVEVPGEHIESYAEGEQVALLALNKENVVAATIAAKKEPDTSETNRERMPFSILGSAGSMQGIIPGAGAALSYAFGSTIDVGLYGMHYGTSNFMSTQIDGFDVKSGLSMGLYQLQTKLFAGNSFYFNLGAGLRTVNVIVVAGDVEDSARFELNNSSVIAELGIGNQWAFDGGFAMDFNWLSFTSPLSSKSKVTSELNGSISEAISQESLDEINDAAVETGNMIGMTKSLNLLRMSLGWRF
jgi:hypothetical protein